MLRASINKRVEIFNSHIRGASTERVALEMLREKKRWLACNDLYYLCCLTGNEKIRGMPEIYRDFCDEVSLLNWAIVSKGIQPLGSRMLRLEDVDNDFAIQRLYLCYRAFYKTTIITINNTVQLLLNFPNIHIAFTHNKQDNASDNLLAVKNCFLTSELRTLFPECIPEGKEWGNLKGFSLANRSDWNRPEDNLEAIGVGTEITGRHWQVAKKNDLETQDSVNTDDQIRKTRNWDDRFNVGHFDDMKWPFQDYEGTRYAFNDLYSAKKNDPNVKVIEIPIEREGIPLHPTRYKAEDIVKIKSGMSIWVYNCQMLLKPDDPARMVFTQDMIVYYTQIPECNFYLLVDPASKRKKKSDYTAMLVIGIDCHGHKYIVDAIWDKLDPKGRIDTAIELAKKWKIKESGWEEVGLGDDNFYLEEERRKNQLFFTVTPIKTQQVAKEDRIRNILMPEYAKHEWFWPQKGAMIRYSKFFGKNIDITEELEKEIMQFPLGQHDDLMDAQTFLKQLVIIKPENKNVVHEDKPLTMGDYRKIQDDKQKKMKMIRDNPWSNIKKSSYV